MDPAEYLLPSGCIYPRESIQDVYFKNRQYLIGLYNRSKSAPLKNAIYGFFKEKKNERYLSGSPPSSENSDNKEIPAFKTEIRKSYGFEAGDYINFDVTTMIKSLEYSQIKGDTIKSVLNSFKSDNLNRSISEWVDNFWMTLTFPSWKHDPNQILKFCLNWQFGINDSDLKFKNYRFQKDKVTDFIIREMTSGKKILEIFDELKTKPREKDPKNRYVKFPKKVPIFTPYYHQFRMLNMDFRKVRTLIKIYRQDRIMSSLNFKHLLYQPWSDIFTKFIMNPYAWYKVDDTICDNIIGMTGRKLEDFREEKTLGYLSRYVFSKMKDLKWTAVPEKFFATDQYFVRKSIKGSTYFQDGDFHPDIKKKLISDYGVIHDTYIYIRHVYEEELIIANFIVNNNDRLVQHIPLDLDTTSVDPSPTEEQKLIIQNVLNKSLSIVNGLAGTGKTTVIKCLVEQLLKLQPPKKICCVAFTGKAVDRIKEVIGLESSDNFQIRTIHSLYYSLIKPSVYPDYIIVDEASMIDLSLMAKFVKLFCDKETNFVFLGDYNQLPPMKYGRPFEDVSLSKNVSVFTLTKNLRCIGGKDDPLIINSNNIVRRRQSYLPTKASNFEIYNCDAIEFADFLLRHDSLTLETLELNKIITPSKNAALKMNKHISEKLNIHPVQSRIIKLPLKEKNKPLQYVDVRFATGDPVIFLKNKEYFVEGEKSGKYQVYNGNEGFITGFYIEDSEGYTQYICVQLYRKNATVLVPLDFRGEIGGIKIFQVKHLLLSYCINTHKSQGSQWDNIYYYVEGNPSKTFNNCRLTYTSITRPKSLCLIAEKNEGLFTACAREPISIHYGRLKERIKSGIEERKLD